MDIKNYRGKELTAYVLGVAMIIMHFEGIWSLNDVNVEMIQFFSLIANLILSASIMSIFVMIIDSIVSNQMKERLVFWRQNLPAMTVFTGIKDGKIVDNRFTKESVLRKYETIYNKLDNMSNDDKKRKRYENASWYQIYKKHKTEKMIEVSNRDYLLCRDLTSVNIMMMSVYLALSVALQIFKFKWKTIVFLILLYIILMIAARMKSKRFVLNVIAADIE